MLQLLPVPVSLVLWPPLRLQKQGCTALGGEWGPSTRVPVGFHSPGCQEDQRTPDTAQGPLWPRPGLSSGWELHFGGLWGPLAEGAVHSCGLPVLGKQKGWHKDSSPVTSWRPGPGKELFVSICPGLDMLLSPGPWSPAGDSLGKDMHGGVGGHQCLRPLH